MKYELIKADNPGDALAQSQYKVGDHCIVEGVSAIYSGEGRYSVFPTVSPLLPEDNAKPANEKRKTLKWSFGIPEHLGIYAFAGQNPEGPYDSSWDWSYGKYVPEKDPLEYGPVWYCYLMDVPQTGDITE